MLMMFKWSELAFDDFIPVLVGMMVWLGHYLDHAGMASPSSWTLLVKMA